MFTPPQSYIDLDAPDPPSHEHLQPSHPPFHSEPRECTCGGIALSDLGTTQSDHLLDSSPFAQHLNTNYAPTSDDIPRIKSLIDNQNVEIGRATQRIAELKQEIDRLCQENAPRVTFARQHEALLAPIRQLPVDLLREIFAHSVSLTWIGSTHKDDAPMVLTRVCRAWREVALSTPELWSSIHIAVPPSRHATAPDPLEPRIIALTEWLARSASTPLRISIYQQRPQHPYHRWEDPQEWPQTELDDLENMRRVMNTLRPAIHRWRALHLVCPYVSARLFFQIPGSEWASIQDIWMLNATPDYVGDDLAPNQISEPGLGPFYSPNLSMVTICNIPYVHETILYPIPWNRITHLCIPIKGSAPCPTLLHRIRETIESLELVTTTYAPDTNSSSSTGERGSGERDVFTLPRLKRFALKESFGQSPIMKMMHCPMLEDLEYDEDHALPESPPSNLGQWGMSQVAPQTPVTIPEVRPLLLFLSRSGALIKSLVFNYCRYDNRQLLDIFASVPLVESISHLSWGWTRNWNESRRLRSSPRERADSDLPPKTVKDVLNAFVTASGSHYEAFPYCPRLRVLGWGTTMTSAIDFLEFLELKQSGMLEGVAKLDEVAVGFTSIAEEHFQRIVGLFSDPRKVVVTCNRDTLPRVSGMRDGIHFTSDPPWALIQG